MPESMKIKSKTSRNARSGEHKRWMSQSFGVEELTNDAKNEAIVNNLYGEHHNEEIDRILGDENLTQRHKEDLLFNMLDDMDLEVDDDLDVSIEECQEYKDQNQNDYVYEVDMKTNDHKPNMIWGRVLSKIMEPKEWCSTVVLKLIDLFMSKNSHIVMENLVYRFLNNRVCKYYGLDKIKELIRKSNPRQRLIDDVKEMHYITEESLQEYHHEASVIVHDSMTLYPLDNDVLINALDNPAIYKVKKVSYFMFIL